MYPMCKKLIYCFLSSLLCNSLISFSQSNTVGVNFADDPIAAMLDSVAQVKYFEKGLAKPASPKNSKYRFAPDSIPRYDNMVYESRLTKLDAESPFDLEYNDAVKAYIDLYSNRKRELVSRVMGLSQLYFPMIEEMLDKYDIPLEMKYLAIVESALNPKAHSRAGATGLWQFMYGTGKMYDLKVTSYVDERCDPYKSTVAACEYLKFLYDLFGDWQMVLAAYNSGPGTVNKAIRRSGGKKTYWEIRSFLPKETQGYVPAFIAVNYVMRHTTEHNLYSSIPKHSFYQIDTVRIKQQITFDQIAAVLNMPVEEIEFLNPQYKKRVIPNFPDDPYTLILPASKIGSFVTNEQAIYDYLKLAKPNSQDVLAMQDIMKVHTVKRGERLNTIANRYKCTVYDLKVWNTLKSSYVKPGQKLTVYIQKATNDPVVTAIKQNPVNTQTQQPIAAQTASGSKVYTIQKGDTLWEISRKTGTSVDEIKRLNNFGKYYVLLPGKTIKVG